MNHSELELLVSRLEQESERHPGRYRLKLLALASLGHLHVLSLLLLALIGLVWCLSEAFQSNLYGAAQAALLASIAGMLFVHSSRARLPQPTGRSLSPEEAPQLFAVIEKVRLKINGLKIHRVLINDEFNTSIYQAPRPGRPGSYRNTLILGLPLMQALSRKEFIGILAHEYGHLTRQHGRLNAWIYRARQRWGQVQAPFGANTGTLEKLLVRFLSAYIPRIQAYSLVQARRDEYEADRLAVTVVGRRTLADALIAQAVRGSFIEERFWQTLWNRTEVCPEPPYLPHSTMRTVLNLGLTQGEAQCRLNTALSAETAIQDTHPSLRERLLALDTQAELPPVAQHSAAQSLLGDLLNHLQEEFDALWLQHNQKAWRLRHHAASSAREIVERMKHRPFNSLGPDELAHYGLALETLGQKDAALPLLRLAADHPHGTAEAAMGTARLLGERGDEESAHYLQLAADRDRAYAEPARHNTKRVAISMHKKIKATPGSPSASGSEHAQPVAFR